MNIILASEVIHPGGAETFILRLAQAFQNKGHKVVVFVFYKELLNYDLCKVLAPDVQIIPADTPATTLLQKADSAFFRLNIDNSIRAGYIRQSLKNLITELKPDVIHSHLLKVDKLCLDVAAPLNIPVVNTIHGDYLQFWNKTKSGTPIPLLNYKEKATSNLQRISHTVCISDKQLAFFKEHFYNETNDKTSKIYNGYSGKVTEEASALKKKLGIEEDSFVYGMVSRGIPDKGWQVAIDAFLKLNEVSSHLVLTGASDYLDELKHKYANEKRIHFTGHSDNPINWINIFDVGLLPSTYPSESLPTVIIEYLYCNKPILASDAGEITNMTGQGKKPAALITTVKDGKVDADEFSEIMQRYYTDNDLYNTHKQNTTFCYEQFDMDKCVEAYINVYKQAADKH